jgi:anti-anti-sigma factor
MAAGSNGPRPSFFQREVTMDITCRREGSRATVDLSGRWSISAGEIEVLELHALVARLIAAGWVHVTFNLRELETLDARGLGEIAQSYKNLRGAGGELTLAAPNRLVMNMLAVTRLDSVIAVCDTECEAAVCDAECEAPRARRRPVDVRRGPFLAQAERAPG